MTPRQLDVAHEFCERVGTADLLGYLGLSSDAAPEEAKAALKARRRKMQGMQSNPKFRDEARLLIKHFQVLDAVLAEPHTHVKDMAGRRESTQLPILEMTIRGVLAGGPLSAEQESYLRNNARDLGVSDDVFSALLVRLQGEMSQGARRPSNPPVVPRNLAESASRVSHSAPPAQSRKKRPKPAKLIKPVNLKEHPPPNEPISGMRPNLPLPTPSLTDASTAPPVRMRSTRPDRNLEKTTAPRALARELLGDEIGGGIQVDGPERVEIQTIGQRPTEVSLIVRLIGDLPVAARITPDDPWVTAAPERLDPTMREHRVNLTVHPKRMFKDHDQTVVRIHNELGEQTEIIVDATRKFNWSPVLLGIAAVVAGAALVAAVIVVGQQMLVPNTAKSLTVQVDPFSEYVLLDNEKIGDGRVARIDQPPVGEHTVTVVQDNFKQYGETITLKPNQVLVLPVRLELDSPLDWSPRDDAESVEVPLPDGPEDRKQRQELEERMMHCLDQTPAAFAPYEGTVEIYIRHNGKVAGVTFWGNDPLPRPVHECLRRHGATVSYPPMRPGTHLVLPVKFEYQ